MLIIIDLIKNEVKQALATFFPLKEGKCQSRWQARRGDLPIRKTQLFKVAQDCALRQTFYSPLRKLQDYLTYLAVNKATSFGWGQRVTLRLMDRKQSLGESPGNLSFSFSTHIQEGAGGGCGWSKQHCSRSQ